MSLPGLPWFRHDRDGRSLPKALCSLFRCHWGSSRTASRLLQPLSPSPFLPVLPGMASSWPPRPWRVGITSKPKAPQVQRDCWVQAGPSSPSGDVDVTCVLLHLATRTPSAALASPCCFPGQLLGRSPLTGLSLSPLLCSWVLWVPASNLTVVFPSERPASGSLPPSHWEYWPQMYLFRAFQATCHFAVSSTAVDIISPVSLLLVTLSHSVSCKFNLPAAYPFFWITSKNDQEKSPLPSRCPYARLALGSPPTLLRPPTLLLQEWLRGDQSEGSRPQDEI